MLYRLGSFVLLVVILLNPLLSLSQYSSTYGGVGYEVNMALGKIIKHSVKFTAPVPDYSTSIDINLVFKPTGNKPWHIQCGYPVTGVGILFTDYNSPNIFGRSIGVYPNLQVPIIRRSSLEWTLRFGLGAAYVNKIHQRFPSPDSINTAVSTHINALAVFVSDIRYHVNDNWDFQAGFSFSHISNALYREPNLGVNMCGIHIGARYFPKTHLKKIQPCSLNANSKNRLLVEVRGGIAHKEARAVGNPVKPAYIGALSLTKRMWCRNKFIIGADIAYHKEVYAFLKNYGVEYGKEKQHSWDGGIFVGHEYIIGRVGLIAMVGAYYRQTFLDFDPVYQKMGAKYYLLNKEKGLGKELFLSALLNTHGVVAEYAEFGLGMSF